ncbi:MAG: glycoside hydrolase family 88 protein [Cyclobacteriaceae bacterium]
MRHLLIFSIFTFICACTSPKKAEPKEFELPLSQQMADSEIKRTPDPRLLDFRPKPKWEYTNGLVCLAMYKVWDKTGEDKYLDYVRFYYDSMVNVDGSIKTYKMRDFNIDRVNPGKALILLSKVDPKPKYNMAIDSLRKQMKGHPRTSEGGFWHKKRYPSQMWLDGLYMGSPFLAQYAVNYNEPEIFADVANQFRLINKYLWNEEEQLYYHGWDESREQKWSNPETGLSPHFWGRAMGWFAMATVDVLDYMPEDHPGRKEVMLAVERIATGIKKHQDSETGVWWQVLNLPDKDGNYREASCTSMFTYFLLKALKKGYLSDEYNQVATDAYNGILDQFIKENEDGTISLTNVCAVAGLGGNPYRDASYEYYIGEPQRDNDPKAIGPFIMASLLWEEREK